MCVPVPVLGLIAGVAQGVVGFMGQQAQFDAEQARFEANREASQRAAVNQYASQQLRISQEHEAAAQQAQDVALEGQAARSTATTAAGEAGVSGLSVDALLQDLSAQEGRFESALDRNLQISSAYMRSEMDATQDQAIARINSVPQPTPPSFGAALVNIFSSGVNAYSQHLRYSE